MVFVLKLDSWKFDLQFDKEKAVISLRVKWGLNERNEPLKAAAYLKRESSLITSSQKIVYSTQIKIFKIPNLK